MPVYQSTLNQTEIDEATGRIGYRCRKELVLDDGKIIDLGWHRFMIEPGDDVDAVLANVQAHLASDQIEGGPLTTASVAKVKEHVAREQTPARIEAYYDRLEANIRDNLSKGLISQKVLADFITMRRSKTRPTGTPR